MAFLGLSILFLDFASSAVLYSCAKKILFHFPAPLIKLMNRNKQTSYLRVSDSRNPFRRRFRKPGKTRKSPPWWAAGTASRAWRNKETVNNSTRPDLGSSKASPHHSSCHKQIFELFVRILKTCLPIVVVRELEVELVGLETRRRLVQQRLHKNVREGVVRLQSVRGSGARVQKHLIAALVLDKRRWQVKRGFTSLKNVWRVYLDPFGNRRDDLLG